MMTTVGGHRHQLHHYGQQSHVCHDAGSNCLPVSPLHLEAVCVLRLFGSKALLQHVHYLLLVSSVLCPLASSMVARMRKRPAAGVQRLLARPASSIPRPEPRVHRYITFRKQGQQEGWIVQWKGKTLGGFHDTQGDAAKTLRDAMGLSSVSGLPKLHPASSVRSRAPSISKYTGVYWHKQKGCYTTRDHTQGSFSTAGQAARATGATRKQVKPSTLVQRVKCIRKVRRWNQKTITKWTSTQGGKHGRGCL